jgi:D-lactate dehydrogenase (cytochrome)
MRLIRPLTDEYTEYLRDESRTTGHADSISFPQTEADVIAILKSIRGTGTQVTIQGARTGLAAAAVPGGGHVMNLSRMDTVTGCRADEKGHFFLSVQPGVILSQLRKRIEGKKFDTSRWDEDSKAAYAALCRAGELFFPTDPTESSATIGGMVACNASGARSFFYGPMRRHVSGLRVVMTNGRTVALRRGECRADGRMLTLSTEQGDSFTVALPTFRMPKVKNAPVIILRTAWTPSISLSIGRHTGRHHRGRVTLSPLPLSIWGVTCFFRQEADSIRYVNALRHKIPDVAAIEFFDGDALGILRRQKAENPAFSQLPALEDWMNTAIYVELHCADDASAAQRLFAIGEIFEQCGGNERESWVARNQADLDRLLFFRHAIPESVNMLIDQRKQKNPTITKLGTDMSVPDEQIFYIMEMYRHDLAEKELQSAIWGHVGDNHLHVNILPRDTEDYLKGKELYAQWAREVTRLGGAVSARNTAWATQSGFSYGDVRRSAYRRDGGPKIGF